MSDDIKHLEDQLNDGEADAVRHFYVAICRMAAELEQPGAERVVLNVQELFASPERFEAAFERLRDKDPELLERAAAYLQFNASGHQGTADD